MRATRALADLLAWLDERGGIVHRLDAIEHGYSPNVLRHAVDSGAARRVRRSWLVRPDADPDLVTAASAGGRVTCVSLARVHGWWLPDGVDSALHLHLLPAAASPGLAASWPGTVHWTRPLIPASRGVLLASAEDALGHIAVCLPRRQAIVVWESAARLSGLSPEMLRGIRWTTRAAHELAAEGRTVLATLQAFVSAVRSGSAPPIGWRDGAASVAIASACYESAASGTAVAVPSLAG